MDKLKSRLDAFSDAIIAIIITIVVLEIPIPTHNSITEYLQFGKSIGIFFISFFFVANIWYQHSRLFNEADTMNDRIFVLEFIFLAFLSLMPLFTKLISVDTNNWTVMAYGILSLIVNGLFFWLSNLVIKQKYTEHSDIEKVFKRVYTSHNNFFGMISVAMIILAYFEPNWALIFYLALPIISFLRTDDQADLEDITDLNQQEQDNYLNLSNSKLRDFRRVQDQIRQKYSKEAKNNPNWRQDMHKEMGRILQSPEYQTAVSNWRQQNQQHHQNQVSHSDNHQQTKNKRQ